MALELLNLDEEPKKKVDSRVPLIDYFNKQYELKTGKRNPVNFGWCMKMMWERFVTTDEHTGEIYDEIPSEEVWHEQVAGFWDDEFARTQRRYHFSYLMKQFGSFAVVEKKEKVAVKRELSEQLYFCTKCNVNHRADQVCPQYWK